MLDESGALADVRCRPIIVAQVDGHCKVQPHANALILRDKPD
jgi:hypothetical protein